MLLWTFLKKTWSQDHIFQKHGPLHKTQNYNNYKNDQISDNFNLIKLSYTTDWIGHTEYLDQDRV